MILPKSNESQKPPIRPKTSLPLSLAPISDGCPHRSIGMPQQRCVPHAIVWQGDNPYQAWPPHLAQSYPSLNEHTVGYGPVWKNGIPEHLPSDRHDPFIRLRDTGRTDMARFKYEMNLQNLARCVGSTCHDGLLAPGMWDRAWRTPRGVGHPETHPRTRGAVGYAEYSSRTLAPGLQLCKECNDTALRRTIFRRIEDGFVHVSCFQPCIEDGFLVWSKNSNLA